MTTPAYADAPALVKPFTASVAANGTAVATISQNSHGLAWVVYQIGFALGQQAPSPQIAAHFNSQPLVASAPMQLSAFASILNQPGYAMETFFYGPPYMILEPGDMITCAVIGANAGDVFTAAAYVNEIQSPATAAAQAAQQNNAAAFINRPGRQRWS